MKRRVILLPLDGSDASLETIPYAADLARATGSGIEVVATLSPEVAAASDGVGALASEALARRLRTVGAQLSAMGLPVETHLLHGDPIESLLVHTEKRRVLAVVLGTAWCPGRV